MKGNSLQLMEVAVFEDCVNLRRFCLPGDSRLKELPDSTFNRSGVEVVIAPGIERVMDDAFKDCVNLRVVVFDSENRQGHEGIRMLPNTFGDRHVFVQYPRGHLKSLSKAMRGMCIM
jgi:hypothetical protein